MKTASGVFFSLFFEVVDIYTCVCMCKRKEMYVWWSIPSPIENKNLQLSLLSRHCRWWEARDSHFFFSVIRDSHFHLKGLLPSDVYVNSFVRFQLTFSDLSIYIHTNLSKTHIHIYHIPFQSNVCIDGETFF